MSVTGLPFDDFRTLLRDLPGPDARALVAARERDAIVVFHQETRRSFLMQMNEFPAPSRCAPRAGTSRHSRVAENRSGWGARSAVIAVSKSDA